MRKIKLALCDDQNLFRVGMASLLTQVADFDLILEAANGQELLDKMARKTPDVVLLDLQMPVLDGIATADLLREHHPRVRIIVLSMHDEDRMILHLLEKGVSGYLLKDTDPDEVEHAIRTVMDEGVYLNGHVSKALHRKVTHQPDPAKPSPGGTGVYTGKIPLSEREKEVLHLICQELSTAQIADKLFLSPRTIEGHRLRLLEKTATKNTAGLVAFAFRNGLA
jgi:two-component system, NarL family, response regulator DegU